MMNIFDLNEQSSNQFFALGSDSSYANYYNIMMFRVVHDKFFMLMY